VSSPVLYDAECVHAVAGSSAGPVHHGARAWVMYDHASFTYDHAKYTVSPAATDTTATHERTPHAHREMHPRHEHMHAKDSRDLAAPLGT
jgi:hypothetical protein